MGSIRRAGWFFTLVLVMAGIMGVLGAIRSEAVAGLVASPGGGETAVRTAALAKIQVLLEQKVVLQKLVDYGVPPDEAMAKIRSMGDRDLHRLASLADRAAEGADSGIGILIGVAIL